MLKLSNDKRSSQFHARSGHPGQLDAGVNPRRTAMLKKLLAILMLSGMLGAIAGCNTMHGLGQDIERGGEKIQDKANR